MTKPQNVYKKAQGKLGEELGKNQKAGGKAFKLKEELKKDINYDIDEVLQDSLPKNMEIVIAPEEDSKNDI